jgi:hypothetical protein
MPKVNDSTTAAVDEAVRTLSEASQRQAAEAERIFSSSTTFWKDLLGTNRKLYSAWAAGVESMLKAGFESQSTIVGTAPALLDGVFAASKTVVGTWPEVVRQYQHAALDALHGTIASTEKLLTPAD